MNINVNETKIMNDIKTKEDRYVGVMTKKRGWKTKEVIILEHNVPQQE